MKAQNILIAITFMFLLWNFSFGKTINIPNDYPTIQQGITAADSNDTIIIENGTYHENLWINKPLTMKGQDSSNTIIDGDSLDNVIKIISDSVYISYLQIKNSTSDYEGSGIMLFVANYCEINRCLLSTNNCAISFFATKKNIIQNCRIMNNKSGIYFCEKVNDSIARFKDNSENLIINNIIDVNGIGINFAHTLAAHHRNNTIRGNLITNDSIGITIIMSYANDFSYNQFKDNIHEGVITAVCSGGGGGNVFHHNSFISNNNDSVHVKTNEMDNWYLNGEGNFWDDYTGHDVNGDGIGEEPYIIDIWNKDTIADFYPITKLRNGPILNFPSNNSNCQKANMTFNWDEVEGALGYIIEISKDRIFSQDSMVYSGVSNLGNSHSITLEFGKTYFWRVREAGDENTDIWSYLWKFTTGIPAPLLLSPENNFSEMDTAVTLEWYPYEYAEKYIIEISKDSIFWNIVYRDSIANSTVLSYNKLEYNSKYFWRVRVKMGDILSYWSDIWSFRTSTEPIILESPSNNSFPTIHVGGQFIRLYWKAKNDIDFYIIELAKDRFFNQMIIRDTNYSYFYRFENPKPELDATYYWHVRAFRDCIEIPMSETWKFTVQFSGSLVRPKFIFPQDSSMLPCNKAVFIWNSSFGAQNYILKIYTDDKANKLVYENLYITDTTITVDCLVPYTKYYAYLQASRETINSDYSLRKYFSTGSETSVNDGLFTKTKMLWVIPNPFSDYTEIKYFIKKDGLINISMFNLLGQKFREIFNGIAFKGEYTINFYPENIAPGIYFVVFESVHTKETLPILKY
ncbi:MAG: NosD domain-containing protein [bacterium]